MSTAVSQIIFNGRNSDGPQRGRSKECRERHAIGLERERIEPQVTDSRCLCSVCGVVCAVNVRACRLHVEKSDDYFLFASSTCCEPTVRKRWSKSAR